MTVVYAEGSGSREDRVLVAGGVALKLHMTKSDRSLSKVPVTIHADGKTYDCGYLTHKQIYEKDRSGELLGRILDRILKGYLDILTMDESELPLYINDEDPVIKGILAFRLNTREAGRKPRRAADYL